MKAEELFSEESGMTTMGAIAPAVFVRPKKKKKKKKKDNEKLHNSVSSESN